MADDLDAILDDALDDFDTNLEEEEETVVDETNEDKLNDLISAAASDINLTDNKNNISNTNNNNTDSKNDNSQDAIEQALNAVASGFDEANLGSNSGGGFDGLGSDSMKGFLDDLLKTFDPENESKDGNNNSNGNPDEGFDNALKKVMTSIFDPSSLEEPISMIVDKYPSWLKENKPKLSDKQYKNYEEQYKTYLQAWNLLKKQKNGNNDHNDEIMDLLFKTFSYGSLPADVMDGMMPDELKPFAAKMTQLEQEIEKEDNDNENDDNNDGNNNGGDEEFDMGEAMKLFEQMLGDVGDENNEGENNNSNNSNNSNNGFQPDFKNIPKLNPQEFEQFEQLMKQNGDACNIM